MKIIQRTSSELILRSRSDLFGKAFIVVWASLFMGIPLFMLYSFLAGIGIMTLTCARLEPTLVRCEQQKSNFFGVVKQPPTVFQPVLEARFRYEEGTDSEGDKTADNWVALVTDRGEVKAVEDFMRINGVRGSTKEMVAIADRINQFLQSEQPSFVLKRDLRWRLGQSIFPLAFFGLFEVIGGVVIFSIFQSQSLVLDKQADCVTYTRHTLIGPRRKQYPLRKITAAEISTDTDSDGDIYYKLTLLPKEVCGVEVMSYRDRARVETIQTAINAFLPAA